MPDLPQQITTAFLSPAEGIQQTFSFIEPKTGGIHVGGVYQDEAGQRWLFKPSEPIDAVREVIASQIYRQLAGPDNAPEVCLIKQPPPGQWMVASKWCNDLQPFSTTAPGMEKMLIASFVAGDVDCVAKNIAARNGNTFRFDFGAALRLREDDEREINLTASLYEIARKTGFDFLKSGQHIDPQKLVTECSQLPELAIDWQQWQTIYDEALQLANGVDPEEAIANQQRYVAQRLQVIQNLANSNQNIPPLNDLTTEEQAVYTYLVKFYQTVAPFMKPINPESYVENNARQHFNQWKQTGRHPAWYCDLVKSSLQELGHSRFLQENGIPASADVEKIRLAQTIEQSEPICSLSLIQNEHEHPEHRVLASLLVHINGELKRLEAQNSPTAASAYSRQGSGDKIALYTQLAQEIRQTLQEPQLKTETVTNFINQTAIISHHRRHRTVDKAVGFFSAGFKNVESSSWTSYKKFIRDLNSINNKLPDTLKNSLNDSVNKPVKATIPYKKGEDMEITVKGYDDYRANKL
ncbi:hypothetical protein ACFORL_11515 [Legionella dresdenensis]|uniref:Dot/Icm T4SS effector n=1 Tax=Legionella dresdenensis TaxID=450200 RepID=A0ABV8CI74_9GAMM